MKSGQRGDLFNRELGEDLSGEVTFVSRNEKRQSWKGIESAREGPEKRGCPKPVRVRLARGARRPDPRASWAEEREGRARACVLRTLGAPPLGAQGALQGPYRMAFAPPPSLGSAAPFQWR